MREFKTLKEAKATNLWILKVNSRKFMVFSSFTELNLYRKANNIPLFG